MVDRRTLFGLPGLAVLFLGGLLLLVACASSGGHDYAGAGDYSSAGPDERLLRNEVSPWLGTPHRMGGLNRRGIDCSGLVMTVYDELYGLRLPRTARAQMRSGRPVKRRQLAAGDLVFFRPTKKYHHVGIYLGGGEFVHTSTSNGVMISRMDDPFWRDCYLTGRRILAANGR